MASPIMLNATTVMISHNSSVLELDGYQ